MKDVGIRIAKLEVTFLEHFKTDRSESICQESFSDQEQKLQLRRQSDTTLVLTINDASKQSDEVPPMTWQLVYRKPKLLGSRGRMVAKVKIK